MPRNRPRIYRSPDGWRVTRPGYGFNAGTNTGPFKTHRAALESLAVKTASAGPSTQTKYTPNASDYRWHGHRHWPMEIR